jgi:hypothetical protein
MDSEDEEETDEESDDYYIYKPSKIIKVDDEYEVKNGLLGLKRDIILKLTTPIIREYEMKRLFSIGKEMCAITNNNFHLYYKLNTDNRSKTMMTMK